MRMSQAIKEARGEHKSLMRFAAIKSKYAKYYPYIKGLTSLILTRNTRSIELKDVVESKGEQAILFKENKSVNLGEGALFYLAWLSLANAVIILRENKINFCDKTMLQIVDVIISKRQMIEEDMVNISYLFNQRRDLFYHLLKFEIEESPLPFSLDDSQCFDVDERLKFNTIFLVFADMFLWEKRNNRKHPGWKFFDSVKALERR